MRTRFDLRPAEYLERERKTHSFNIVRLVALFLLLAFLGTCGGALAMHFFEMQALADQIEETEGLVADLESQQAALTREIARLKTQEEQFTKTLKIMQSEAPTLEVMSVIESNMERGMGLNTIRFAQAAAPRGAAARAPQAGKDISWTAAVEATALMEEQIVALTDGLSRSGAFTGVTMPSSKKDEKTGRVDFNLSLNVRPLGQIDLLGGADGGGGPGI
ncbi:MAG: hypothetical protein IJR14_10555 [Synergistaceae bacterium]|nr:hypothetical protein [Synergistaceae bacterium]